MNKIFYTLIIILTLFYSTSQTETCNNQKNWFFGRGVNGAYPNGNILKMTFDCITGSYENTSVISTPYSVGFEGTATINNFVTGNWEVYSDGNFITSNGGASNQGLPGNFSSSQAVLFASFESNSTTNLIAIFNPSGDGESGIIKYTNITSSGSIGSLNDIPLPSSTQVGGAIGLQHAEGMKLITKIGQIGEYWLITKILKNNGANSTDAIVVYDLTQNNIEIHQVFNLNTNNDNQIQTSNLGTSYCNFDYSCLRSEIAIADGGNLASLGTVKFDAFSGYFYDTYQLISNFRHGVYDVEYSPDENLLYYSDYSSGKIYAYNLITETNQLIINPPGNASIERGCGLATGPDGNIYAAIFGTNNWQNYESTVWRIQNTNNPIFETNPLFTMPNFLIANFPAFLEFPDTNFSFRSVDTIICPNFNLTLNTLDYSTLSNYNNYQWYHENIVIENQSTPSITISQPGSYTCLLSFNGHCSKEIIQFNIEYNSADSCQSNPINPVENNNDLIYIPNIIQLSSISGNNIWYVTCSSCEQLEVIILNRWGQMVRNLTGIDAFWDGKDNEGKLLHDGTYFYILKATLLTGEKIEKNGFIELR